MGNSVSVIIPNYNQAHYLERLVPAFMRQSLRPSEVLIIDDGSTDDSVSRIQALARQYPEIRLLVNEGNRGVVYSVNRGIREAKGEFLSMYGCDDMPLAGYLEREVALLNRHPRAALCVGNPLFWYEDKSEAQEFRLNWSKTETYFTPDEAALKLRNPMFVHPGSGLVRRERLLEIGGYDPALEAYCDWFAWLVLIFRHGCCYIPAPFQLCSISDNSYLAQMNKDPDRPLKSLATAMRKVLFGEFKDVRPQFETSNVFSGQQDNAVRVFQEDPEIRAGGGYLLIHRALSAWSYRVHGKFESTVARNWYVEKASLSINRNFPLRMRIAHLNTAIRVFAYRHLPQSIRDPLRFLVRRIEGRRLPAQND
jgi:glycosyltransferase involved in cell wall biosynthesis